jgi:voltage-gated potassium channel
MIFIQRLLLRLIHINNRLIFAISALLIAVCSFLICVLEPETFDNPFNGFWWVMTTVTTVGYGDYYPHTVAGKCLGVFLYLFGIGFISIVIGKIIDFIFMYKRKKEEGKLRYRGECHFVIIDWSMHAELAVQEILTSDPDTEVVLIDTLERAPFDHKRVHYIQGNPVQRETLDAANLAKARAVFIFANETTEYHQMIRDTSFIDGKTLLIATAIERLYSKVYTIVEIKDQNNIDNFTHIHVDEFIVGSETVSKLAVRSAFHPGASRIVSQLLSQKHGEDLHEIGKKPHWTTYRNAFDELLKEGATLISDGERMDINRRLDERIRDDARLFVICDHATFARLKG